CCTCPVNVAVSSCNPRDILDICLPKGIMTAIVNGTARSMIKVIFQSMINNSVTAPIIDMIPEMNCGKWSEIKSMTILISLTTLLTVSPLAVWSKYVTVNRLNRTQMLSRNAATTFCTTAANKYNDT